MSELLQLTDSAVETGLGPEPTLLAFCTSWCQPCRQMAPALEAIAGDYAEQLRVAVVDVESSPRSVAQFQITGYPTCVLLEDEREIDRLQGMVDGAALRAWLAKVLSSDLPAEQSSDSPAERPDPRPGDQTGDRSGDRPGELPGDLSV